MNSGVSKPNAKAAAPSVWGKQLWLGWKLFNQAQYSHFYVLLARVDSNQLFFMVNKSNN